MGHKKQYKKVLKEKVDNRPFIKNHLHLLADYELNDILHKIWTTKFKQEFGYTLFKDFGKYAIDAVNFSVSDVETYEDIVKAFKEFTGSSELSPKEMKEKNKLSSLYRHYYARQLNKKTLEMRDSYGFDSLLLLLDYVINGELGDNLARVIKILEDNGLHSSNVKGIRRFKIKGLEPLEITYMKNGKIVLDGLSEKHYQEIERLMNLISTRR